jgi:anti-sigma factor RsiW
MSVCERIEEVRDYAFGELPEGKRGAVEEHVAGCAQCSAELDGLQLTTAALRILPDQEIPQRIAFVSDKVFAPSGFSKWFGAGWLNFASACVVAAGLVGAAFAYRPVVTNGAPAPVVTATKADVTAQVNDAVAKAVAQIRSEDERVMSAALTVSEHRHEQEYRNLQDAMKENVVYLEKEYGSGTLLASRDLMRSGEGQ